MPSRLRLAVISSAALALALALALPGCRSADLSPSDAPSPDGAVRVVEPAAPDAGVEPDAFVPPVDEPSVRIDSPSDGAVFVQDEIVEGDWAARVTFSVCASDVGRVDVWADDDFLLGDVVDGALTYWFRGEGLRRIAAIGYDAAGVELARDEITLTVEPPGDTSCHAMLDALGVDWEAAGPTRGIADPVRVQPVINGVAFRYVSRSEPTAMLMDCELAIRLSRLTEVILPYGIDELIHIGIYNYRCIGGGDPDSGTCTPSQHAYARAIDIHAFGLAGTGDTYSTETDWVITRRADECPIDATGDKDRILKEIACTMWAEGIFQIVLTPNYNAAHRNHFHVDLSEGSMYLGQGVSGLDPLVDGLGH
ncbi:MAG: extensin family protein [Sandaracinaceae bacterium]